MADENTDPEMSLFSSLPEDCVANVISFTSPRDACRNAAVSLGFKSAAGSDTVWERFLPPNYAEIITESGSSASSSTKKELYLSLCESGLRLDGGKLSFRLRKSSGKKCYMLSARMLDIAWKDTPVYWNWKCLQESRFADVVELLSVCWLDIGCKFPARLLSPNTMYGAYLVFNLTEDHYGLDCSAKASVKCVTTENEGPVNLVYIASPTHKRVMGRRGHRLPVEDTASRRSRDDGWMEIELGEIFIEEGDGHIQIRVFETESLKWKRGLVLEGIELRPKEVP